MRYWTVRLADSLFALWSMVTIVFLVTRLLGDPAVLLLPPGSTEEALADLRRSLGLDRSLLEQYASFLMHLLRGDFGTSYQFGRPALDVVLERVPATLLLAGSGVLLGLVVGAIAGTIAAFRRGTVVELLVMISALIGQATPSFWLGIMLILLFAVDLGWFPSGGYGSPANLVLPTVSIAVVIGASVTRLLRSSILDVLSEDYVRTAQAKGLARSTILTWHVGRNALIPVVTMVGILMGELLGGAVVTETIFSWPGVGRMIIQAIENKDFPVVQAGVTVIAAMFILINLLIDLLYGLLDPRIRFDR
ncbi:MAG: ABC transporter permease [Burkholderiaceae bacterium]